MPLPSSGALSMSAINAEFGRGNNLNSYRGTQYYTSSAGPFTFPSGTISFNNFYGTQAAVPSYTIEYYVAAGGGGGGGWGQDPERGGGGGAGGVVFGSQSLAFGTTRSVGVGGGGAGGIPRFNEESIRNGQQGSASTLTGATTAVGGGGGGTGDQNLGQGGNGGSGGGSSGWGATRSGGSGTSGQGNNGGGGQGQSVNTGGGGGYGSAGGINFAGSGATIWIYGTKAAGGPPNQSGQSGGANTSNGASGSGPSGGNWSLGGTGGSGFVVIRYAGSTQRGSGGSVTISGGFVYHFFSSSGTFTA
jgi:hypothetical protein